MDHACPETALGPEFAPGHHSYGEVTVAAQAYTLLHASVNSAAGRDDGGCAHDG